MGHRAGRVGAVNAARAPSVERRVSHRLDVAHSYTRLRDDLPALHALVAAEQESPEQVVFSVTARAAVREMLRRENAATRLLLRPLADRIGVLA
jgi:anti-sigma-K factor RskA